MLVTDSFKTKHVGISSQKFRALHVEMSLLASHLQHHSVGHENIWQRFVDTSIPPRTWFWNCISGHCFFEDTPVSWTRFIDPSSHRVWWYTEATDVAGGQWFYEPLASASASALTDSARDKVAN